MVTLEHSAPAVFREFTEGSFVAKLSEGIFNQLHTDQALWHIDQICNIAGGL
jgi:hypothetical protein